MGGVIAEWLGLSTDEQVRASGLSGRIKSVAEFFTEAASAVNDTDFPTRIAEACPWWVGALGEAAKAAPAVKFVAEFIRAATEVRDPDKLAWLACTAAFQRATELAFASVGPPSGPRFGAPWQPPAKSLQSPDTYSFKDLSLTNLQAHPFVRDAESLLQSAAESVGYDETERRRLLREVAMRFPGELKRVLSHPDTRERFVAVADWLRFDDEDGRVFDAWRTHADYQRRLFEEAPVFGEEPFALADVYVDTECGRLTWGEILKGARKSAASPQPASESQSDGLINPFDERYGGRHDLLSTVMDLIGDSSFRDAIVVQGPAGSGKSAFTLRLALELLRNGLTPIRVRLRDIGQTIQNIDEAIPEAVRFCDESEVAGLTLPARSSELFLDGRLFDQSVAFRNVRICPYVLIFDGWDEVSVSAARGFFERIDYILGQIRDRFVNRPTRPAIRVILTGRPSDAVARSAFLKQSTVLLTIRSLSPTALRQQIERLVSNLSRKSGGAVDLSRFQPVLEVYQEGFGGASSSDARTLQESRALEVLGLPLLAHLAVRLLIQWPSQRVIDVVASRTTLYRLLTDHTCGSGAFGKDAAERRLQPLRLRTLLQQTAVAMTVYGRDSIPYGELEQRLSELVEKSLFDEVREIDRENPVAGLVINFFFKGGQRELGAEFTHKSFREYLTAEAVVEALKEYGHTCPPDLPERPGRDYWKEFDPGDPRYRFSRQLGRILGAQWVTPEIATDLKGLIEWELQRSRAPEDPPLPGTYRTAPLGLSGWRRVRDGLADLWDWWGEGVHLRPQPQMRGKRFDGLQAPYVQELIDWRIHQDRSDRDYVPSPPGAPTIDAVLGDALCRLAALVHRYVAGGPDARWTRDADEQAPPPHKARRYQSWGRIDGDWQLRFKPSGEDRGYFDDYCHRINAAGPRPGDDFPGGVYLAGTDLSWCSLPRQDVSGCNFSDAELHHSSLGQMRAMTADFRRANLRGCVMPQGVFRDVNFEEAELSGTRFDYSRFSFCNLAGAALSGASLSYASLSDCTIAGANFSNAHLGGLKATGITGTDTAVGFPTQTPAEPQET